MFLTGGAFTETTREFLARVETPCVEKPFDPAVLRSLIAEVVASAAAPQRVLQGQQAEASPPA